MLVGFLIIVELTVVVAVIVTVASYSCSLKTTGHHRHIGCSRNFYFSSLLVELSVVICLCFCASVIFLFCGNIYIQQVWGKGFPSYFLRFVTNQS